MSTGKDSFRLKMKTDIRSKSKKIAESISNKAFEPHSYTPI